MNDCKLKVAHVTFDMRIGGAEQVILNLVSHTDKRRFDVSILCLETTIGPFGQLLMDQGIKLVSFGRKPGFDLSLVSKIRSYIKENSIDILHCHQYTPYVYGVLAALPTPCKVIFTEHGRFHPDVRKMKRVIVNPVLALMTKSITAISSATVDALVDYENFSRKDIALIYNGLDDTKFRKVPPGTGDKRQLLGELGVKQASTILGTVARLDPIKNQALMIQALAKLLPDYPDTVLLIVGDGPERENLVDLTRKRGLEANVVFTGFRKDTHRFYALMDIFLLTSFSEGAAMTLIEAMASSLPCIVTDVGGNPELIDDQSTGLVVPSNDLDLLVASLSDLMSFPEKRVALGHAGRKKYDALYTIDKMVESYQRLYLEP